MLGFLLARNDILSYLLPRSRKGLEDPEIFCFLPEVMSTELGTLSDVMPLRERTPNLDYLSPDSQIRRVFHLSQSERSASLFCHEHAVYSEFVQFLSLLLNLLVDWERHFGVHLMHLVVIFGFVNQATKGLDIFDHRQWYWELESLGLRPFHNKSFFANQGSVSHVN